jgi:pyruvate kinase
MPVTVVSPLISSLLAELKELRESCLAMEREFEGSIAAASPQSSRSVQNLLHYLALRKHDLRDLQSRLAAIGLSSLGRSESSALAGLEAVIAILESLTGQSQFDPPPHAACVDFKTGPAILAAHADHLLGPVPKGRTVRVMVTMPSEAAVSYERVKALVDAGMDVMRVNCAHDSEREWESMITHMRRANQESGKHCKVVMDLAGPKLRTVPSTGDITWCVGGFARMSAVPSSLPRTSRWSVSTRRRNPCPPPTLSFQYPRFCCAQPGAAIPY